MIYVSMCNLLKSEWNLMEYIWNLIKPYENSNSWWLCKSYETLWNLMKTYELLKKIGQLSCLRKTAEYYGMLWILVRNSYKSIWILCEFKIWVIFFFEKKYEILWKDMKKCMNIQFMGDSGLSWFTFPSFETRAKRYLYICFGDLVFAAHLSFLWIGL